MAKVKKNVLLDHVRGKIGDLVFREVGGQTILSKAPSFGKKRYKKPNKGCTNFKRAAEYARGVQDDPEILAEYSQKASGNRAAYHVAVGDCLKPPEIRNIDISGFHGHEGDKILVTAVDNFKVVRVQVEIATEEGRILEAGDAAPTADPEIWAYTVGAEYESTRGLVARAFAWDRPENKAEGTVIC